MPQASCQRCEQYLGAAGYQLAAYRSISLLCSAIFSSSCVMRASRSAYELGVRLRDVSLMVGKDERVSCPEKACARHRMDCSRRSCTAVPIEDRMHMLVAPLDSVPSSSYEMSISVK